MKDSEFRKLMSKFSGEMKDAVVKTEQTGLEHGFNICKSKGRPRVSNKCVGDECSLELPRCERGKNIASFHTHPGGSLMPTPSDVGHSFAMGEEFFCIGKDTGKVFCWRVGKFTDQFQDFLNKTLSRDDNMNMAAEIMLVRDQFKHQNKIVKKVVEFDVKKAIFPNSRTKKTCPVCEVDVTGNFARHLGTHSFEAQRQAGIEHPHEYQWDTDISSRIAELERKNPEEEMTDG